MVACDSSAVQLVVGLRHMCWWLCEWTRRIHDRRVRFALTLALGVGFGLIAVGDECGDWKLWKQGLYDVLL